MGTGIPSKQYGAPTGIFLRFFGRIHLRIGVSRAKNCEELKLDKQHIDVNSEFGDFK